MTRSEYLALIIDKAKQKALCCCDMTSCKYRGDNGKQCVIGIALSDEDLQKIYIKLNQKMNHAYDFETVNSSSINSILNMSHLTPEDLGFEGISKEELVSLQKVHDSYVNDANYNEEDFINKVTEILS